MTNYIIAFGAVFKVMQKFHGSMNFFTLHRPDHTAYLNTRDYNFEDP